MLKQNTPDFFYNFGLTLARVVPGGYQLGNRFIDVSAFIGDHAIITSFFRTAPSTHIIECALIRDETGIDARICRPGLVGFMLSIAVGGLRSSMVNFSSPVDVATWAIPLSTVAGKFKKRAASEVTIWRAASMAPCSAASK